MADYYPLISKAVAGLDPATPRESRQILYERARATQLTQLRTISPPLSEAEITCERLALEEAVHRVEVEVAQRAKDDRIPTLNDLVTAADDIGKATARAKHRSSVIQAKAPVNPSLPSEGSIEMPAMIVTGGATGRLIRFWRWRSHPPRNRTLRSM
ncbi:hypothetical protein GALL_505610 [mine drainage metagenome]|uniref:Uncharacterized protein n=1 Tax=mine drainage metagenome TaxID=410659 RepID=A0A1J5P8E8_9ZZZZ